MKFTRDVRGRVVRVLRPLAPPVDGVQKFIGHERGCREREEFIVPVPIIRAYS